MSQYATFRHESKRLQAVRIAHLIPSQPVTWRASAVWRTEYDSYLSRLKWTSLSPYFILKAKIWRVCYLNPADLGRWGGEYLPCHIGAYQASRMIPAELILTACSDDDVDGRLRKELCIPANGAGSGQVEVLSWFGYTPAQLGEAEIDAESLLWGPFHRLGKFENFNQLAFLFLQHQAIDILTDIRKFFDGLDTLTFADDPVGWKPLLCTLLKGNIDGFLVLGKRGDETDVHAYAEQLSAFLADGTQRRAQGEQPKATFWSKVSPIALYFGEVPTGDIVLKNVELLPELQLPVTIEE
jgi:hypothetical protein